LANQVCLFSKKNRSGYFWWASSRKQGSFIIIRLKDLILFRNLVFFCG
jgi:hypothetical protein